MADINFIDFGSEPSFIERFAVDMDLFIVDGIQLLPNNELPYYQVTSVDGGIYVEDWTAEVYKCDSDVPIDITQYVVIEEIFTDNNGDNQFIWSLTNVPYDFGQDLVYIKLSQDIGESFYSNYFKLTNLDSNKTSRLDYKSYNSDYYQSIQLSFYFKQYLKNQEIDSYYQTSTGNTVTNLVKSQRYEHWITKPISNDLLLKISDVFEYKYLYLDQFRFNLYEAIDIPEFKADENFSQSIIKVSFNKLDVFNPLTQFIPVVDPLVPEITLNSVVINGVSAIYDFNYVNFSPDVFTFQISQDESNWSSINLGVTSPQLIPFTGVGTWYFRISHPKAVSNTVQLDLSAIIVAVNDDIQVEKGDTISINVIFNDILVGDTELISVTQPTNGTAGINALNNTINYTHNDSSTTFDSFTYTIGNGITTSTATVNIVITTQANSTSFTMATVGKTYSAAACVTALDVTMHHNGVNVNPTVFDYVFTDASQTIAFNGGGLYYAVYGGKWIVIDNSGMVTNIGTCNVGGAIIPE